MTILPPLQAERLVIPILLGANDVDVGVNPRFGGSADTAGGLADTGRGHSVGEDGGGGGGGEGGLAAEAAEEGGGRTGDKTVEMAGD